MSSASASGTWIWAQHLGASTWAQRAPFQLQAEAVALRIPLRLLSALRHQQVQSLAIDSSSDADDPSSDRGPDAPPAVSPAMTPADDAAEQSASGAPDIAPEAAMAVLSGMSAEFAATCTAIVR